MTGQEIPIVDLSIQVDNLYQTSSQVILSNEIESIQVNHIIIPSGNEFIDHNDSEYRSIYLFVRGKGQALLDGVSYDLVPESILLPNDVKQVKINATDENLQYIKVTSKLTSEDLADLKGFPTEHTKKIYFREFADCQSYSEPIKSPNTISRTILPNKYIPRVAMGTVQTTGPDQVGEHAHPMLEQLFLGLSQNNCTVFANDAQVNFTEFSVLHIPLGSKHSVSVDKDKVMYYVWMDFFLDKKGEEWLNTHIVDKESR